VAKATIGISLEATFIGVPFKHVALDDGGVCIWKQILESEYEQIPIVCTENASK